MRKLVWIATVSAALVAGACKEHESAQEKQMEQAAKAAEHAQKDVKHEAQEAREEQGEAVKAQQELAQAEARLAQARAAYAEAAKARLAKIDQQLGVLAAYPATKPVAEKLLASRNAIAAQLDLIGKQTKETWEKYTKELDQAFDNLEHEIDQAMK